jgi:polysaccharide pyruvyl transferase WcaK-like protein
MLNKGDAAVLSGAINIVSAAFPDAKKVIVSHTPEIDVPRCSLRVLPNLTFFELGHNFKSVIKFTRVLLFAVLYDFFNSDRIFSFPLVNRLSNETLTAYAKADLVVHRGGDNLTEDYGALNRYVESILIGIMLRKPVVILGESIGPFTTEKSKHLAKVILNKVDVIVTREKLSVQTLKNLSISKPKIFTFPDVAFTLQQSSLTQLTHLLQSEHLEKLQQPVFVISISALISNYGLTNVRYDQKVSQVITTFVSLINHYREKLGVSFVFMPHVIGVNNDDRVISRQIFDALPNKNGVYVIEGEYSHQDFKVFLSKYADVFIGARMHACIAAVSVGVPTISIAYGQKAHGILGDMVGLSDFIIDIRKLPDGAALFSELSSKVDLLWCCRQKIRRDLTERMIQINADAWKSAEALKMFYEYTSYG